MMKRLLALMSFVSAVLLSGALAAQTVLRNDNIDFIYYPGTELFGTGFSVSIQRDLTALDSTNAIFTYDGTAIDAVGVSVDLSSEWYVVQPGDNFSRSTIAAGSFTLLLSRETLLSLPPAPVGPADFYLGIATHKGSATLPQLPLPVGNWPFEPISAAASTDPTISSAGTGASTNPAKIHTTFAWVHLRPENGALVMVESAIAYDAPGILVGTLQVVPEPALASVLTALFLVPLLIRRRR